MALRQESSNMHNLNKQLHISIFPLLYNTTEINFNWYLPNLTHYLFVVLYNYRWPEQSYILFSWNDLQLLIFWLYNSLIQQQFHPNMVQHQEARKYDIIPKSNHLLYWCPHDYSDHSAWPSFLFVPLRKIISTTIMTN